MYLPRTGLGPQSSYLYFPRNLDDMYVSDFFLRYGLANNLFQLASSHDPSISAS
jgi:hypothetical protein